MTCSNRRLCFGWGRGWLSPPRSRRWLGEGAQHRPAPSPSASRPQGLFIFCHLACSGSQPISATPIGACSRASWASFLHCSHAAIREIRCSPAHNRLGRESAHTFAAFPPVVTGGRKILRLWALKHRQFPVVASLVKAKNVEIAVVALDLEVVIVSSRPSIDGFDDFDDAPIQPNALRLLNTAVASIALDFNPHDPMPSLPSVVARLNAGACSAPPIARRRRGLRETALFHPRGPQSVRRRGR